MISIKWRKEERQQPEEVDTCRKRRESRERSLERLLETDTEVERRSVRRVAEDVAGGLDVSDLSGMETELEPGHLSTCVPSSPV
jgi:adenine-specific DNA methylase